MSLLSSADGVGAAEPETIRLPKFPAGSLDGAEASKPPADTYNLLPALRVLAAKDCLQKSVQMLDTAITEPDRWEEYLEYAIQGVEQALACLDTDSMTIHNDNGSKIVMVVRYG